MEHIEALLNMLGENIGQHTDEEYKGYNLKDRFKYYGHIEKLFNQFRIELVRNADKINFFDLLKKVTDIQERLTMYYQFEILSIEPIETGIDLPEVKEWEEHQRKRFKDNGLYFMTEILQHEIEVTKEIKKFIVQTVEHTTQTPATDKKEFAETGSLLERVRFEGEQSTLVASFFALLKINKLSFNKENHYSTEEIHFADFLEKNFSYKDRMNYVPVKNVAKALADLRQQYKPTADKAKEKVDTILDDAIKFLNDYKTELQTTELRHKEKNIKPSE